MDTEKEHSESWMERAAPRSGMWVILLVFGLVTFVLGLITVFRPGGAIGFMAFAAGVYFLISGFTRLWQAMTNRELESRWLIAFAGILGVMAGLIVWREPFRSIATIAFITGLVWVVSGLIDLFTAGGDSGEENASDRSGQGVIQLIGGLFLLLWPAITVVVLAWLLGIFLMAQSISSISWGLRARRLRRQTAT